MTALLAYEQACRTLAAAVAIDEVKDLHDKAVAMRVYARQAKNRQLEIDAAEIRLRAERRLGVLLAEQRAAGALRPGAPARTRTASTDYVVDRVFLKEAGIDERLGNRARKYAALPSEEFEGRLAQRRQLVERGASRVPLDVVSLNDKAASRNAREVDLAGRITALPDKKYGVILADPEWRFAVRSRETGLDRAADNHYPTSETAAIAAREVATIAADDCVLFLWGTVPMLSDALAVMIAWGFAYKSNFVWAKDRIGTGYWNRNRHEHLLVGTRGTVPAPAPGTQWESVLEAAVGAHSAKPERFLELVEAYFPTLPKIELNRRGAARPGWDAWGNEAVVEQGLADCDHASLRAAV